MTLSFKKGSLQTTRASCIVYSRVFINFKKYPCLLNNFRYCLQRTALRFNQCYFSNSQILAAFKAASEPVTAPSVIAQCQWGDWATIALKPPSGITDSSDRIWSGSRSRERKMNRFTIKRLESSRIISNLPINSIHRATDSWIASSSTT